MKNHEIFFAVAELLERFPEDSWEVCPDFPFEKSLFDIIQSFNKIGNYWYKQDAINSVNDEIIKLRKIYDDTQTIATDAKKRISYLQDYLSDLQNDFLDNPYT